MNKEIETPQESETISLSITPQQAVLILLLLSEGPEGHKTAAFSRALKAGVVSSLLIQLADSLEKEQKQWV